MYFAHLISSNNRKSKVHFEMCAHFNSQSESRFFFLDFARVVSIRQSRPLSRAGAPSFIPLDTQQPG